MKNKYIDLVGQTFDFPQDEFRVEDGTLIVNDINMMDIVKECQHVAIRAGAPSVSAYVKIAYKPEGGVLTIDQKVTKHHQ